ncbi:hypothetical protein BC830DRAFT_71897 [Chytriomyces sp. MP71]|nr:hypothetical protein BC830DRAFT_71897 [Chytriomyces sp. MP71]
MHKYGCRKRKKSDKFARIRKSVTWIGKLRSQSETKYAGTKLCFMRSTKIWPGSQKAFPEFLADYPINMWRTVLLYAQKPPSLTHVGNLPRRSTKSAPHDKKREPQGESAMIPKIFKSAKEKFEAGDLEAVKMLLCDIINQLRSSGSVRDIQEDLDHYSISQAIQDAIDQAGITLMGCERLLIGYIHKLGGNVEKVIEHLKKD